MPLRQAPARSLHPFALLLAALAAVALLAALVQVIGGVAERAQAARQSGQAWPPQQPALAAAERAKAQAVGDAAGARAGLGLQVAAWSGGQAQAARAAFAP